MVNKGKNSRYFHLILMLSFCLYSSLLLAQSEDGGRENELGSYGAGAGALARGGASIGRPDESTALFWNPAYLDKVAGRNVSFFVTTFVEGTSLTFSSITFPTISIGTFGAGIFHLSSNDIEIRDGNNVLQGSFSLSQQRLFFSYGKRIYEHLSVGGTLNIDRQSFFDQSDIGLGADVALHYDLSGRSPYLDNTAVGFVYRNVISPSLRLGDESESPEKKFELGVAKSFEVFDGNQLTPMVDVNKTAGRKLKIRAGGEYSYKDILKLRVGYESSQQSISAGFGVSYHSFTFDYAFRDSDLKFQPNLISVSYSFGPTRTELEAMKEEEERTKIEIEIARQDSVRTAAEIENHTNQAVQLFNKGDYFGALSQWQRVLAFDPQNQNARSETERIRTILDELQRRQNVEERVRDLFALGEKYFLEGDYYRAVTTWDRVLELDPTHQQAREFRTRAEGERRTQINGHLARAQSFYTAGNYQFALNEFHEVLRNDPQNSTARNKISELNNKLGAVKLFQDGLLLYESEVYPEARAKFQEANSLDPTNEFVSDYLQRVTAILRGGRAELPPEYEKLYGEGMRLFYEARYKEAITVWNEILKVSPFNNKVLRNIQKANERLKTLERINQGR